MQFVFAPVWGRLSDRIGRRPVLLISTLGAAASYVLFGISCGVENHTLALWLMVASRAFAGICGGNITVAQAYIADVTPPQQRSKKMGLIGMAFGLGFIFGPIIGGVSLKHLGHSGPGWIAAGLCAANFLLALFILRESRQPTSEHVAPRPRFNQWTHTLGKPQIGLLVGVFFLATFCFSCFESTLPLLVSDNFQIDIQNDEASASTVIYLFAYCGIISAFVQGGAIGRLVKKLGEPKLIALSLIFTALSLGLIPFIKGATQLSWGILLRPEGQSWLAMLAVLALLSIGSALTRPPLFGLLSNLTSADQQGETIGVAQSAGSLARILGPIFATTTLHYLPPLPYLTCMFVLLATAVIFIRKMTSPHSLVVAPEIADVGK
jgi:MFS family permease